MREDLALADKPPQVAVSAADAPSSQPAANLQTLIQTANDIWIVVDHNLTTTLVTGGAKSFFVAPSNPLGVSLRQFGMRALKFDLAAAATQVLQNGATITHIAYDAAVDRAYQIVISPCLEGDRAIGATIAVNNISELKAAQQELKQTSDRLHTAMAIGGLGLWEYDPQRNTFWFDQRAAEIYGFEKAGIFPDTAPCARTMQLDVPRWRRLMEACARDERCFNQVYQVQRAPDDIRWVHGGGGGFISPRGEMRAFGIFRDVTDERHASDLQVALLREMNHRVKNLFAMVSALLTVAKRDCKTADELVDLVRGRITALASAHDYSRGETSTRSLKTLIDSIVKPFCPSGNCRIEGPEIELNAAQITSLALILHEWGVNGAKYGPLLARDGRLNIGWTVSEDADEPILTLFWAERGTRLERATSAGGGFGETLIRLCAQQLGGNYSASPTAGGFDVCIAFPLSST